MNIFIAIWLIIGIIVLTTQVIIVMMKYKDFETKSKKYYYLVVFGWPLYVPLLVIIWPYIISSIIADYVKYVPIIVLMLFALNINAQALKQIDTKDNLPVYQIQKDSIGDATQIGFVKQGAVNYPLYKRNKPNSKGKTTCFYFAVRIKPTKTQTIGQWYKKSCDCPE